MNTFVVFTQYIYIEKKILVVLNYVYTPLYKLQVSGHPRIGMLDECENGRILWKLSRSREEWGRLPFGTTSVYFSWLCNPLLSIPFPVQGCPSKGDLVFLIKKLTLYKSHFNTKIIINFGRKIIPLMLFINAKFLWNFEKCIDIKSELL